MMQVINTQRLILRGFEHGDVGDLYAYAKSSRVGPMAGWRPHEDLGVSQSIIDLFISQQEVWAIVDRNTDQVIGSIGLHNDAHRDNPNVRMLGYVLAEQYWGQGFMVEAVKAVLNYAFKEMKLQMVSVGHFTSNQQSQRVINKCGFLYEGTIRQAKVLYDGSIVDIAVYSMTNEEYFLKF